MIKNNLIVKWLLFCCVWICLFSSIASAQTKHVIELNDLVKLIVNDSAFSPTLTESRQLLLVITSAQQHSFHSTLRFYQKNHLEKWQQILPAIPVNLGKNGVAWDREQQAFFHVQKPHEVKKEGDNKTPLGIYPIIGAFGFSAQPMNTTFPYIHIGLGTEAVDDIHSQFYNRIVQFSKIQDWHSSEKMWKIPCYKIGLIIGFNERYVPGAGSNVFIHIWRNKDLPTMGCIAMSEVNLKKVLLHLNFHQHPFIAILPRDVLMDATQI